MKFLHFCCDFFVSKFECYIYGLSTLVTLVIINEIDLHFKLFSQSVSAWIGIPTESSPHGFPALVTGSPQESPLVSVASLEHTQLVQHPCLFSKYTFSLHYLHLCRVFQSIITQDRMRVFLSHFTFNEHFCFKSFTFVVCACPEINNC